MGSEGDMNFLLGKMSFDSLLSYLKGSFMSCLFPKMYKVELSRGLKDGFPSTAGLAGSHVCGGECKSTHQWNSACQSPGKQKVSTHEGGSPRLLAVGRMSTSSKASGGLKRSVVSLLLSGSLSRLSRHASLSWADQCSRPARKKHRTPAHTSSPAALADQSNRADGWVVSCSPLPISMVIDLRL
jgi:hypothetical protein